MAVKGRLSRQVTLECFVVPRSSGRRATDTPPKSEAVVPKHANTMEGRRALLLFDTSGLESAQISIPNTPMVTEVSAEPLQQGYGKM